MTTVSDVSKQLLPRPPQLLPDGNGYDWREFNRWLQRVYALLGVPQNTQTFNITTPLIGLDAKAEKTTTVNGHPLDANVVVSASDLTTGTLPHGQLPAIAEADVTGLVADLAGKQPHTVALDAVLGVNTGDVSLGTANGLSLAGQALSLQAATAAVPGALTAADFTTFAAKEPPITAGTTAQYLRGDKSLGTLNQAAVAGLTSTDNPSFGKVTAVGADPAISTGQGIITSQDSTALAANVGGTFVARGIYTGSTTAGFGGLKWGKSNATAGNLDTYLGIYTRNNAGGILERIRVDKDGYVGIGTTVPKGPLHVVGLPVYANNAAAITGGLTAGAFYRTGADPDPVCVVH